MRAFLRFVVLAAALLVAVPVALAAQPDAPERADKPEKADKPQKEAGNGEQTGRPEDKGAAPGQAKKGDDVPEHPLGGAPGQLKEPGAPATPELTKLAETVGASPNSGTVRVKAPDGDGFVDLTGDAPLPTGTVVDATAGLVEIGSEAPGGIEQNAVVTGGVFRITQAASGVTDLTLQDGDFSQCKAPLKKSGKRKSTTTARAAAKKRKKKAKRTKQNVARGLWAAGKGRFRTKGRNAVASVRGTRWAIVDRCHSSTVKVFDGVVDVKDLATGKTIAVRAGERHVARERRR